eukprot:gene14007-15465_t
MATDIRSPLDFVRRVEDQSRVRRWGPMLHCSEVTDHPFANCYQLKRLGKCSASKVKLNKWCPRSCGHCIADKAAAAPVCKKTKFGCCADGVTVAKGLNKEGCPENCKDIPRFHCRWYAKRGYCRTHMETMKRFCPQSCNFCGKKIVNGCFNAWDDKVCEHFAVAGICRIPKWKVRVTTNCARSCEVCTKGQPALLKLKPSCAKEGCCWDNKTPINKGCPPCKNYFSSALCTRFKDDCYKLGRIQGVQMRIFCPNTCGLCNQQECKDDITHGIYCKQWKKQGECERDPLAMRVFCRKTCNLCSSPNSTSP